jgi:cytochrome b561
MSARNTATSWGWPARLLHWVMALMILGMLAVGTWMANFEADLLARFELTQTHKSLGFTVFVLAVLRVVWRFANPTPALPRTMPRWQVGASHASHLALYVLILAMPLSGWLMASSSPLNDPGAYPLQIRNMVWGWFEMPDPYPKGSAETAAFWGGVHAWCAVAMALILLVHVAAAVKHHAIDRDGLLKRMIAG